MSDQDKFGRTLFDATCSDCGQATKVPFEPKADRPVYCQNCFPTHRKPKRDFHGGGGYGGGGGGGRGGGRGYDDGQ